MDGPAEAEAMFALADRCQELEAIVAKLPKCWRLDESDKLLQDVPVVPGMDVWLSKPSPHCCLVTNVRRDGMLSLDFHGKPYPYAHCTHVFSTREAAAAAGGET